MRFRFTGFVAGFAIVALAAATTNAAIVLQFSPSAVQPSIQAGGANLIAYDLRAVSDSGQVINTVGDPNITAPALMAGLHQVWTPVVDGPTPTRAQQAPPLWSDTWRQYDSFFLFDATNSLGVGGEFTETNSHAGGAALPTAGFGAPNTGFGGISAPAGASKLFTVGSGLPDSDVTFAQIVVKEGEGALVDMRVFDNTGAFQDFADFCVGMCVPGGGNQAPTANDFTIPLAANYNANLPGEPQTINQQLVATDPDPGQVLTFTLGALTYTPNYGAQFGNPVPTGPAVLPTLSSTGVFNWVTEGSPRGIYSWSYTATDNGQPNMADTATIEIHVAAVPEPSTLALLGLAMVGGLGMIRRRNG